MSGGGTPPDPPDYAAAAAEQGRWNLEAARAGAQLNRPNMVGPGGSTTYTRDPHNPDQYTQTTELSPEQQILYNRTTGNAQNRAAYATTAGGRLNTQLQQPIDFSGQPKRVSSVASSPYDTSINAGSVAQRGVDLSGQANINSDFGAERQRVEDSLYGRATERLDPQFAQREEATRTQLMNQGIREGSEAWNNSMRDFGNTREDAYAGARNDAIQAGGAEQSRLFADALSARQQGVGEQFGLGEFANQAAQQEFGNEAARTSLYNQGQDTQFSQGLSNAGLTNTARDAGINESMIPRQQSMQEFMQLYGDYQGTPQPGAAPGVGSPAAGDYAGAVNQAYGAEADIYNADQARRSSNTQAGVGIASMLAMLAMSDRRAKTDIERIGTLPNGIPTYRFRYIGEDTRRMGVMSDEVREFMPQAVVVGEDGYDRVDYAMIGAAHLLRAN